MNLQEENKRITQARNFLQTVDDHNDIQEQDVIVLIEEIPPIINLLRERFGKEITGKDFAYNNARQILELNSASDEVKLTITDSSGKQIEMSQKEAKELLEQIDTNITPQRVKLELCLNLRDRLNYSSKDGTNSKLYNKATIDKVLKQYYGNKVELPELEELSKKQDISKEVSDDLLALVSAIDQRFENNRIKLDGDFLQAFVKKINHEALRSDYPVMSPLLFEQLLELQQVVGGNGVLGLVNEEAATYFKEHIL